MRNKVIILALIFTSSLIVLPAANPAAASDKPSSATASELNQRIRVNIGPQRGRRGRHWDRNRHRGRGWDRRHARRAYNRTRVVRQTYYVNGRRYVRYVRVRY